MSAPIQGPQDTVEASEPTPQIPPLRTFRIVVNGTEEYVEAHRLGHLESGAILFEEAYVHPMLGVTIRVRKGFASWDTLEEVITAAQSPIIQ